MKSKILTMTAERSNIRAIVFLAFLSLTIALNPGTVSAITFTITSNIDWSAISGGPPGASDIVTVKNGATLTINVSDAVCGELNLGSGNPSGGDGTVSFNSGSLLTIITSTATVFIGKASGGGHAGFLDMTNGGKLICNTLTYIDGVFTPGAGTIEFQSTAATNLPAAFATYHNLVMNGTGSLKQGVNTSLTGDLDIHTGTFDTDASNNYNLDVTGNIRIDAPASFNANNSVITLQADLTNIGIFNKGNSTLTFDGAGAQQISGSSLNLYEFILNKSSGLLTLDINV
ncbi:MAG: hypothetical protein IIA45_12715, partial [Bacteroidetes bacterium]|nr:hypothetical protein [Bacteroidota bacterium]